MKFKWSWILTLGLVLISTSLTIACSSTSDTIDKTQPIVTDITLPIIEEINVVDIKESSAVITWQTNESATSQVEYSINSDSNFQVPTISSNSILTTEHHVLLQNLDSNTTHYFRVRSIDVNGNEATSEVNKFSTLRSHVGCNIGDPAPDFTLRNIQGEQVRLSDYLGKVVVINFWFLKCPICRGERDHLQEAFDSWSGGQDIVLLTVHCKGYERDAINWIIRKHYTFPVLFDREGEVAKKYCIWAYPMTYFVNAEGIIQQVKIGNFRSYEDIQDMVNSIQ